MAAILQVDNLCNSLLVSWHRLSKRKYFTSGEGGVGVCAKSFCFKVCIFSEGRQKCQIYLPFPFRVDHFSEGTWCAVRQKGNHKSCHPTKNGEKLQHVYSFTLRIIRYEREYFIGAQYVKYSNYAKFTVFGTWCTIWQKGKHKSCHPTKNGKKLQQVYLFTLRIIMFERAYFIGVQPVKCCIFHRGTTCKMLYMS